MKIGLLTCGRLPEGPPGENILKEKLNQYFPTDWVIWNRNEQWKNFDVLILRSVWDYSDNILEFRSFVNELLESNITTLNSPQIISWNFQKTYLKQLSSLGVSVIPTELISKKEIQSKGSSYYNDLIAPFKGKKLILKPLVGAGSKGLVLCESEDWHKLLELVNKEPVDLIVQPFEESIFDGEISIIFFDKKYIHAVKKVPNTSDFRAHKKYDAKYYHYEPKIHEMDFANEVLDKVRSDLLYARVDYILKSGKPFLMELELIEPDLYFDLNEKSYEIFVTSIINRIGS
jgi:glutathione synthase/RimK-type ligase-like ATP-grasp enzyme